MMSSRDDVIPVRFFQVVSAPRHHRASCSGFQVIRRNLSLIYKESTDHQEIQEPFLSLSEVELVQRLEQPGGRWAPRTPPLSNVRPGVAVRAV